MSFNSEIRNSTINTLLEKTRKKNYRRYLSSIRLEKIRLFNGDRITFDFPVTALIGPNGGGKSTIIGVALLAYQSNKPSNIFKKSRVGDEGMNNWLMEFEIINKESNKTGTERFNLSFVNDVWNRSKTFHREVKFLSISRTVPISENPLFSYRKRISVSNTNKGADDISLKKLDDISDIKKQSERILGKSLENFIMYEFTFNKRKKYKYERVATGKTITVDGVDMAEFKKVKSKEIVGHDKQILFVGSDGQNTYSEFNFGAGETSVIRMVAEMETLDNDSLVLIEEIENGLHPIAVRRVVEYLIDIAQRKNLQVVFTTHSDYALEPLPSEGIWACIEGRLQQGKLSIEALRAVSGRFDRKLAIFVEDEFAKSWIEYLIREKASGNYEEIGVYAVGGDGNAVKVHLGHTINPSISFKSICYIDGDSLQKENKEAEIFRLPGEIPELEVFDRVIRNIDNNIALLTVACQKPIEQQEAVLRSIKEVSRTNRDPHLIFSQIGLKLGFISAEIIKGAFLSLWVQENKEEVEKILGPINDMLLHTN
jgi:predicted ATPase